MRTSPNHCVSMRTFLSEIWGSLGGDAHLVSFVHEINQGDLPSAFAVSALASASIASAGLAMAELLSTVLGQMFEVQVDRRLSSFWFSSSLKPEGWMLPPAWDSIAGDYAAADGWIRLHTNAPHHRDAVLMVLGTPAKRDAVASAVARLQAEDLEAAVVHAGGCAAVMRTMAGWGKHDQGKAVTHEPLVWFQETEVGETSKKCALSPERPLLGLRVLDLTRVLAGPVATRFLAGFGADVLRLDPPWWDEPGVIPEITLGKRCARLDLCMPEDRTRFIELLSQADVLVHGYRADALDRLGLDATVRRRIRPGLIDVSLNAYGWTGPWRNRRGFDSLVQMSSGIAEEGMRACGGDKPTPLPVQALDHATGYFLAAAAIRGLVHRLTTGRGSSWRASLARTAVLLQSQPFVTPQVPLATIGSSDYSMTVEETAWGPAHRLKPPLYIPGAALHWDRPAGELGSATAQWSCNFC